MSTSNWRKIKIYVDTYSGIKTTISKLLESGRMHTFKREDTKQKLKQLHLNIKNIEERKTTWTDSEIKRYETLVKQSFFKIMGIEDGRITKYTENGISLSQGLNNKNKLVMSITPIPKSATPGLTTGNISSLQELLQNWEHVDAEMQEHDVQAHRLSSKYEEYEEWKERFKEAAGLGLTNDRIFKVLDALDVNRHHLFTLQGYLVKEAKAGRTYNLELDNLDINIFSTIQQILSTKGKDLDKDDIQAIKVLTLIRDQIL